MQINIGKNKNGKWTYSSEVEISDSEYEKNLFKTKTNFFCNCRYLSDGRFLQYDNNNTFFYFTNIVFNYSKEVLCHPRTSLHTFLGDKAQFKRRKNSTWMHYLTLSVSTCPLLKINSIMFIVAYALIDYRLK